MPKGNPTPQTIASEKYQKKAGYMTKGFKIKREAAERFERAIYLTEKEHIRAGDSEGRKVKG